MKSLRSPARLTMGEWKIGAVSWMWHYGQQRAARLNPRHFPARPLRCSGSTPPLDSRAAQTPRPVADSRRVVCARCDGACDSPPAGQSVRLSPLCLQAFSWLFPCELTVEAARLCRRVSGVLLRRVHEVKAVINLRYAIVPPVHPQCSAGVVDHDLTNKLSQREINGCRVKRLGRQRCTVGKLAPPQC